MMKNVGQYILMMLAVLLVVSLGACSGSSGKGSGVDPTTLPVTNSTSGNTTVAGKVALSALSATGTTTKPSSFKPVLEGDMARRVMAASADQDIELSGAVVQLFDAEHPEFIYPVAETLSDENGNYILDELRYADKNNVYAISNSDMYVNEDPINPGRYSLIASKYDPNLGKLFVAVQTIVKNYEGAIEGNDLVAQDSDAVPEVLSMFARTLDPVTGYFGEVDYEVARDADIQVTFSQAMARLSVIGGTTVYDITGNLNNMDAWVKVPGKWKVSANLLSAAFVPTLSETDATRKDLTLGRVYAVKVNGGKSTPTKMTVKNVFGRAIAADAYGYFVAGPADPSPPQGAPVRPSRSPMFDDVKVENGTTVTRITAPIRIETDKPLDISNIDISVNPSIGEMPSVMYLGYYYNTGLQLDKYIYDIVPSKPLRLDTAYSFTVDGATDLAGNPIVPFSFNFVTEVITNGVSTTAIANIQTAQAQVKDVFGKWLRSFSDKKVTMLTNYTTGDFLWVSNDSGEGGSEDDLNRDGRLSSYEFTRMLKKWFQILKACDSKVTGDVVGDINVWSSNGTPVTVEDYDRASMTFFLHATSENYTNAMCQDSGPEADLYIELKRINGAWYVSKGADQTPLSGTLDTRAIQNIEMLSPIENAELTMPYSGEIRPTFKWTGIVNVSNYAVIVIDERSQYNKKGWVALVDGTGTENAEMTMNFNPKVGASGNSYILDVQRTGWFEEQIQTIKPGGRYIWSVLAFDTLTQEDIRFRIYDATRNLKTDLIGASLPRNFSVEGRWLELEVKVKNILGKEYAYDPYLDGYDLIAEDVPIDVARMEIFSPSGTAGGEIVLRGLGEKRFPFTFSSGMAMQGGNMYVDLPLYQGRNEVNICDQPWQNPENGGDITCPGLKKRFWVMTRGGEAPVLEIVSRIDNATGTDLGALDSWGSVYNATVEYLDVNTSINGSFDNSDWLYAYVNVWNDSGFNYWNQDTYMPGWSNNLAFANVPVASGWNTVYMTVQFYDFATGNWHNFSNYFNVEVGPTGGVTLAANQSLADISLGAGTLVNPTYEGPEYTGPLYMTGTALSAPVIITLNQPFDPVNDCTIWSSLPGKGVCGEIKYVYVDSSGNKVETFRTQMFADGTLGKVDWIYNSGTGGYDETFIPLGPLPDLDLYSGMNAVAVIPYMGGSPSVLYAYSESASTYVPELSVNVTVKLPTTATLWLDWSGSDFAEYYSNDVDSVTVSGVAAGIATGTPIINGVGYNFWTNGVSFFRFANVAADGSFSFDVDLGNQWNSIEVMACTDTVDPNICALPGDDPQRYNLNVYTEGGTTPPKWVSIDSPAHNTEIPLPSATPFTVYGHIDNSIDGFTPEYISAYVFNMDMGTYQWFDNDPFGMNNLAFDTASGMFFFTAMLDMSRYEIGVYADNYTMGQWHGHYIYVNNTYSVDADGTRYYDYVENFYKPGAGGTLYTKKMTDHSGRPLRRTPAR